MDRLGLGKPGRRLGGCTDAKADETTVRAFPLGWMLAGSTVDEMREQATNTVAASLGEGGWLGRLLQTQAGCGGEGPKIVVGGLGR